MVIETSCLVFLQVLDDGVVDGFGHVDDLESTPSNTHYKARNLYLFVASTDSEVDMPLVFLHVANVMIEGAALVT